MITNRLNDHSYMKLAYKIAKRSPDPSTQVGAVLLMPDGEYIWGYNRFPEGVENLPERWNNKFDHKYKYFWVSHAEEVVISLAARYGYRTEKSTLYVTLPPCANCAKNIIECGIKEIISDKRLYDLSHENWRESTEIALQMFKEAKVKFTLLEGDFKHTILFAGEKIQV